MVLATEAKVVALLEGLDQGKSYEPLQLQKKRKKKIIGSWIIVVQDIGCLWN